MQKLKFILTTVFISVSILMALQISSQAPQKMSYQAVIRTANNQLVINKSIGMQLSLLQGNPTGTAVYVEKQLPTSNANGLISIEIGDGTIISGNFSSIDWPNGPYFIKTETDINGGSSYTISGTSQLLSVPFALYAEKADFNSLTNKPSIPDTLKKLALDAGNQNISNLSNPINDYDAATKAYVDLYVQKIINSLASGGVVKDYEGNIYQVVTIGDQIWMAENLRSTKYHDGSDIMLVTDNSEWENNITGAYTWFDNDPAYKISKGALYNWYTVNTGKLCPSAWHVPSDEEWTILTDYLGGENISGGKLKETGTVQWLSPNIGATNETGFTALPAGFRAPEGYFNNPRLQELWWSISDTTEGAWVRYVGSYDAALTRRDDNKASGYSVRCIKD
jgi:uncharacterized protein (TIGR02145 family)